MEPKTKEQLQKEVDELKAKLAAKSAVTLKVSEKGGVSMYGLGRFPVTLYKEQWETVLANAGKIGEFLTANADKLKSKAA